MHRRTMMVLIAICLSVLLIATLVGCSTSDNSDRNSNDGGEMMDDRNSNDGGEMMDDDGSGGDQGNGSTNP